MYPKSAPCLTVGSIPISVATPAIKKALSIAKGNVQSLQKQTWLFYRILLHFPAQFDVLLSNQGLRSSRRCHQLDLKANQILG